MLSFRADEHVDSAFVTALRAEGYNVSTAGEDYEPGLDDEEHLADCRQSDESHSRTIRTSPRWADTSNTPASCDTRIKASRRASL